MKCKTFAAFNISVEQCWKQDASARECKGQRESDKVAWKIRHGFHKCFFFCFQKVHGNGKDNLSRFDVSTKRDQLRIAMMTMCKVIRFLSFL